MAKTVVKAVEVTDKNQAALLDIIVSMYLDEPCRICGTNLTKEDSDTMVFAGYSANNESRTAHYNCWFKVPSTPQSEWAYPINAA